LNGTAAWAEVVTAVVAIAALTIASRVVQAREWGGTGASLRRWPGPG
jgi:hypothetical protein